MHKTPGIICCVVDNKKPELLPTASSLSKLKSNARPLTEGLLGHPTAISRTPLHLSCPHCLVSFCPLSFCPLYRSRFLLCPFHFLLSLCPPLSGSLSHFFGTLTVPLSFSLSLSLDRCPFQAPPPVIPSNPLSWPGIQAASLQRVAEVGPVLRSKEVVFPHPQTLG